MQLETRLTEVTRRDSWSSHADIDQDDVSLAGVLEASVGRAVCYCFSVRAPLLGDNTRLSNPHVLFKTNFANEHKGSFPHTFVLPVVELVFRAAPRPA